MIDIKGYKDNVQTIAKTQIITDRLDKLITDVKEAVRQPIDSQRIAGYQDASAVTSIVNGSAAGATGTTGVGVTGGAVSGAQQTTSPVNLAAQAAALQGITDAAILASLRNNVSQQSSSSNNDISSQGKQTGDTSQSNPGGGGGSQFTDQATLGENNPDWQTIKSAKTANGASDAEINTARIQVLNKEKGVDEVGDVVKGNAGPKPFGSQLSTNINYLSPPELAEVNNGFVGVNPDNHSQAMLVRTDGASIIPSIADVNAYGQNPWVDANTPPIKKGFELGYYWVCTSPEPSTGTTPSEAVSAAIAAVKVALPGAYPTGYSDAYYENLQPDVPTNNYKYDWYQGPGATVNHATCTRDACPGSVDPSYCPSVAPVETAWPITGVFALSFNNGQVNYNPYDSEVPLAYKGVQSTIKMHSLATGQDYFIEPAINGGYMVYDTAGADGYFLYFNAARQLVGPVPSSFYNFYTPRRA